MKKIIIAFEGFWNKFNKADNFIVKILKEKYDVQILEPNTDEEKKKVQYLFYSCFSDDYLDYDCVRIFFTGENISPDFNLCDYAIGFDYISFLDRYIRYPLFLAMYQEDVKKMLCKEEGITKQMADRKFCSMVVSNVKNAEAKRKDFFDALSLYMQVDSGGRFMNNVGKPQGVENKENFQKKYKFSIAFENSSHPGYCTEKIVQGFAAKTVPIYWGDETIAKQFNPKAFINCHEYDTIEQMVNAVKRINENDKIYIEMLNAPAIAEGVIEEQSNIFKEWLFHIVDQEHAKAYRRNRYGRCVLVEQELLHSRKLREKEISDYNKVTKRISRKLAHILKI